MAPGGVELRPARAADRGVIWAMVLQEQLNPLGLDWRRFLLAVDQDGAVIGCVQIKAHGQVRELASLVVRPAWRGRGVARLLIERIRAGQAGPLYLMCRGGLQPLYALFGFRALERREMPPYFRRIHQMFGLLRFFNRRGEMLAVMKWE